MSLHFNKSSFGFTKSDSEIESKSFLSSNDNKMNEKINSNNLYDDYDDDDDTFKNNNNNNFFKEYDPTDIYKENLNNGDDCLINVKNNGNDGCDYDRDEDDNYVDVDRNGNDDCDVVDDVVDDARDYVVRDNNNKRRKSFFFVENTIINNKISKIR